MLPHEATELISRRVEDETGVDLALDREAIGGLSLGDLPAIAEDDTLGAHHGNDVLTGGCGADLLLGGRGGDTFAFGAVSDSGAGIFDRIADWEGGTDRVDLSAIDAVAGTAGNDAFVYVGGAAFGGTAGELRFVSAGGDGFLVGDVDGNGAGDLVVALVGRTVAIDAGDIVL